ncbi:MAG: TRAP transporter substrate-binding protein DctP [Verrucomicrobiae bacterium]|nr:TRAP transporter substrate-binding protein DctP [Verrucomicrobiae bacterium]
MNLKTIASSWLSRFWRFAWVPAAIALLAAPVARAQGVKIKLATLAPDGSAWHLILKDMGEQWKQLSGGRVTLVIYPGGVAGDEPDMVRKMRIGQIHAAAVTGTGIGEIDPGVQALQIPMLYQTDEEFDYVRAKLTPKLEARLKAKGFVVLNWGEAGWVHFFATKPVVRPDDLKALKLFTWGGDSLVLDLWKAGGFHPVPLASTDIMPGLQTGMINAFATPPMAALSFQWYPLAPNMSDLRWSPLVGATIITAQMWERVPADAREPLMVAARKAGEAVQADVRKSSREAVEAMKKRNLRVVPVPPDAAAEWRANAEKIYPKLRGPFAPAELFDEARQLVAEFRAKSGKAESAGGAAASK